MIVYVAFTNRPAVCQLSETSSGIVYLISVLRSAPKTFDETTNYWKKWKKWNDKFTKTEFLLSAFEKLKFTYP